MTIEKDEFLNDDGNFAGLMGPVYSRVART